MRRSSPTLPTTTPRPISDRQLAVQSAAHAPESRVRPIGSGNQRDHLWAASVLEALAAKGVVLAQATLAALHRWNLGDARDRELERRYFELAAKRGDGPSMLALGSCKQIGWLEKAAAAGEAQGYLRIANCHLPYLRVEEPDLGVAEAALRAYVEACTRAGESAIGAEGAYERLERALGRPVERPLVVRSR